MNDFFDIFISYGRSDSEVFATNLYSHFTEKSYNVWFDQEDMPPGVDFQQQIYDSIDASNNFIFIISPRSVVSEYCLKTIEHAVKLNKRIIPLLHIDPGEGMDKMHAKISELNWIYFDTPVKYSSAYNTLTELIESNSEYIKNHTQILIKALKWDKGSRKDKFLLDAQHLEIAKKWCYTNFDEKQALSAPIYLHCELIAESKKFHNKGYTDVFVSYARENVDVTNQIRKSLNMKGYTIWIDTRDIKTGDKFEEAIVRGIEQADNVLFFISPHSVISEYCLMELKQVRKHNKRIIPILIEDTPDTDLPKGIAEIQYLNLIDKGETNYNKQVSEIVSIIDTDTDYYNRHKEILVEAIAWEKNDKTTTNLLHGFELEKAEKWLDENRKRKEYPPTGLQKRFIEESRKSRVSIFISYGRRQSSALARRLHDRLNADGYNVWFDMNDIPLGVDFQEQIDSGIENADNFLFIISPHSVVSEYCLKEVVLAVKLKKRIIPIIHVDPEGAWEHIHPVVAKLNWIYMREEENSDLPLNEWKRIDDYDIGYEGLHNLLQLHADYVKKHTYFLNRALEWQRNHKNTDFLLVGNERQESEDWLLTNFTKEQPPCHPIKLHTEYLCESKKNADNLMTDVFLSYARENISELERFNVALHRYAITTWADTSDIEKGEDFQEVINEGIAQADTIIYLLSPASLQSEYCRKEIEYAKTLDKRIIPLLIEDVDNKQTPKEIKGIQYISFVGTFEDEEAKEEQKIFASLKEKVENDVEQRKSKNKFDEGVGELIHVLNKDKEYYFKHKVFLVKALKWEKQKRNESILLRGYNLQNAEAWVERGILRTTHKPLPIQEELIKVSREEESDVTTEVFISYSRTNADFARRMNNDLQTHRKTTWFDQESIAKGVDFAAEINNGIETSDNFLFIISPRSINSQYCDMEVEHAKKNNKRFITVLYEDIDIEDLNPDLAAINWIDFRLEVVNFNAAFGELLQTLNQDREHVQYHTRWLNKAKEWDTNDRDRDRLLRGEEYNIAKKWLDVATKENKTPRPTKLQKIYIAESGKAILALIRREKRILLLKRIGIVAILMLAVASILLGIRAQIKSIEAAKSAEEAQAERKIAVLAKEEAEKEKEKAEESQKEAVKQANIAQQKEIEANEARKIADQKRVEAQNAKEDAEQKRIEAEIAEARALQKEKEAKEAKVETERANKKAMFHLYVFNAKEFANKSIAKQAYNEKLKNDKALLALTAIDLENVADTFGYARDYAPELLEALQTAYHQFQSDKLLNGETWAIAQKDGLIAYSSTAGKLNISKLKEKGKTEVKRFEVSQNIETKYKELVRKIQFCGSPNLFAMGTSMGNIYLYKKSDASYSFVKLYDYSRQWIISMTYLPKMNLLATAANNGNWKLYDVAKNFTLSHEFAESPILSMAPGNDILYTGDKSGQILQYNIDNITGIKGKAKTLFKNQYTTINSLEYNEIKKWLIAGLSDGNILKYNPDKDRTFSSFPIKHKGVVSAIAFSSDNNWIATGGYDGIVMLWNIKNLENTDDLVPIIIENEKRKILSLTFDNNNQYLIYGDNQSLHIRPIDIKLIYKKLDAIMKSKRLTDKEWEYYKKGDLEKPRI